MYRSWVAIQHISVVSIYWQDQVRQLCEEVDGKETDDADLLKAQGKERCLSTPV